MLGRWKVFFRGTGDSIVIRTGAVSGDYDVGSLGEGVTSITRGFFRGTSRDTPTLLKHLNPKP